MTLTKARIVENLYATFDFSKEKCVSLVENVFELIKDELKNGDDVRISGFGKWSVRQKNPRRGRNPQTGETIMLDSRRVVTFKCSGKLRKIMAEE
ncbi:MAG: integration host factor subunit alpha [Proteobacteria bacterium]|nr:integration host factor subunit alpha [Pseudomonadota bacterium]